MSGPDEPWPNMFIKKKRASLQLALKRREALSFYVRALGDLYFTDLQPFRTALSHHLVEFHNFGRHSSAFHYFGFETSTLHAPSKSEHQRNDAVAIVRAGGFGSWVRRTRRKERRSAAAA